MRTDSTGLDYWLEGSVKGEGGYPFHQSICVGNPSGNRACISFGVAESDCLMGCGGEIYQDTSAPGPIGSRRVTSPAVDAAILARFQSLLGQPGRYYLIGNNCRTFSQKMFLLLDLQYFPDHTLQPGGGLNGSD